jgi:hypothetical protein
LPVSTCSTLKTQFHFPLRSVDGDPYHCSPDNVLLLEWKPWTYFPECLNCTGLCELDYYGSYPILECYPFSPFDYQGMQSDYVL